MIPSVPQLLKVGASAPAHVDPVDAVMGEIRLGGGRGGLLHLANAELQRDRRSRRRTRDSIAGVLAPNPQALVKLIGTGGAKSARGLRAQMAYLSREGGVPLRSSESTFGTELGPDDAAALSSAWGLPKSDRGGSDRTSHFVVSFPEGTDHGAAERAGRAWAAALFDNGTYGDRWDYYTAFHTDKAHPHVHVVVCRRGLDHGRWLKIARRGELSFDRLREVQVEVAAREGIFLTGTSRLSRGVHDRPVPDAEYRRAQAEGRAPVAPEHSLASAIAAAAEILDYARSYEAAAAALRTQGSPFAERLEAAAHTLVEGGELVIERGRPRHASEQEKVAHMVETTEKVVKEIREDLARIETNIGDIRNPRARADFLRSLSELKARSAPYVSDDLSMQTHRDSTRHSDYRGLPESDDARAKAIKSAADREVARVAERHGLDPEATAVRFGRASVSMGLGADYAREEWRERWASHQGESEGQTRAAVEAFHTEARAIYREASRELRGLERERPRAEPTPETLTRARQRDERAAEQPDAARRTAEEAARETPAERGAKEKPSRSRGRGERSREDDEWSR